MNPHVVIVGLMLTVSSRMWMAYFLLAAGEVSRWHRVTSDEAWHFHEGDPLDLWTTDTAFDFGDFEMLRDRSTEAQAMTRAHPDAARFL